MTEITRVPLQPVARGSLGKLWLGVAAAALAAGGLAWTTLPAGVEVAAVKAGTGRMPTLEEVVVINYVGKLKDGTEFDRGERAPMPLRGVVKGFSDGLLKMAEGGKYKLTIPAALAYGAQEQRDPQSGRVVIPANSDLVFDVEVLGIMSEAEFRQYMQVQQMMQMQAQQQAQGQGQAPGQPQGAIPPQ